MPDPPPEHVALVVVALAKDADCTLVVTAVPVLLREPAPPAFHATVYGMVLEPLAIVKAFEPPLPVAVTL